jgi:polysaccharide chain length determinant protein (PEP-CTERM system associated)
MDDNEGLKLSDLLAVVRRRRGLIATMTGSILLAAIFLASVLPNEYETYATLLVEPQTISETLVTATQGETDLSYRLNLMAAEILSRARLSRIIDALELYQAESREMTREDVIEMMRDHIQVLPVLPEFESTDPRNPTELNTFQIFFRHRTARTAAEVANRLANDFVEEHIQKRTRTSSDTSEFIEAELGRLAKQIQEVEERIAGVKAANTGSLPEDLRSTQTMQERAYDEFREAQRTLAEAEADVTFYRQQEISATTFLDPRDQASPEQRLEALELKIAEYKARGYTDKHPDVIASGHEIEELRAGLEKAREADEAGAESRPPSVAQQNAAGERHRAELRVKAAQDELQRLQAQVDEFAQRIGQTPRVAEQLDALQREYEHLYESYREFSRKRLDAAVAADMERQVKGERFRVLESAVIPPEPTSPNRPVIFVVGLMLGLALGGGLSVLLEAGDDSFHTARKLQSALRIPVLAAIPGILLEQDRARRRRRRIRITALASLVTLVALAGSGVGYVWVNGVPGAIKSLIETEPSAEPVAPERG